MRVSSTVLLAVWLLGVAASPAHAEDPPRRALLVLDRGEDARDGAAAEAHNALRIWKTLEARGVDARLAAAGVGATGETLVVQVVPTRAALAALDGEDLHGFRGPTDARAALSWALDAAGTSPVDVILLGPFSPVPAAKTSPHAKTVARWNEKAPEGSRIFALGPGAGRAALADARGFTGEGHLVIGFGRPQVDAQPFSPFPGASQAAERLAARVRVLADVVGLGAPTESPVLLRALSDVAEDEIEEQVTAGLHTWRLARLQRDGRTATLRFEAVEAESLHWLGAPPTPVTFRWDALSAAARLLGAAGEPPAAFAAVDVQSGVPVQSVYRLQRTLSGPAPAWRVGGRAGAALPEGLQVRIGPEMRLSPEVAEAELRVTFTASPGRELDAAGAIVIAADGVPDTLELPYTLRVEAGRATLEADVEPAALPPARADPRTRLLVRAANANVPATLVLTATCDGPQAPWLRARLESEAGDVLGWSLDEPLALPTASERRVSFELAPEAPEDLPWPCRVTLALAPLEGVRTEGEAVVEIRRREPRLVLEAEPLRHRVAEGSLRAEAPIALRLEADGGDGEWLLGLQAAPPSVAADPAAPVAWQVAPAGPGRWHLVPTGRWSGPAPALFEDTSLDLDLRIVWAAGGVPPRLRVPVGVPARWGKRGVLLLILAGLALLLGALVVGVMRTPAVRGTLLYAVDGLEGAVGRLDLAPIGRRTRTLTSDAKGRLAVAGRGDAVAKVRPTRVGGLLEYTERGGERERRLLVDGLSVRIGRHLVRYVSGRQDDAADRAALLEVPDLLGPEYDLEGGRIDALGEDD